MRSALAQLVQAIQFALHACCPVCVPLTMIERQYSLLSRQRKEQSDGAAAVRRTPSGRGATRPHPRTHTHHHLHRARRLPDHGEKRKAIFCVGRASKRKKKTNDWGCLRRTRPPPNWRGDPRCLCRCLLRVTISHAKLLARLELTCKIWTATKVRLGTSVCEVGVAVTSRLRA